MQRQFREFLHDHSSIAHLNGNRQLLIPAIMEIRLQTDRCLPDCLSNLGQDTDCSPFHHPMTTMPKQQTVKKIEINVSVLGLAVYGPCLGLCQVDADILN